MSATRAILATEVSAVPDAERWHRRRVIATALLLGVVIVALSVYGFDYYRLGPSERPYSPKHDVLRPSGHIGLNIGIAGVVMFCILFLYALRKQSSRLRRIGNSQHWLDFHVVMGIAAPIFILFHSAFKFRGLAGFAFWTMIAVALSGVAGRYLYNQLPRQVLAAGSSFKDAREVQMQLAWGLASQRMISVADLQPILSLPSLDQVLQLPLLKSLFYMVGLDMEQRIYVARLRRRFMFAGEKLSTIGGLLRGSNAEVEQIIDLARDQARFSKRVLFFSRAQELFRYWHVIHKPFSYAFAVLVFVHVLIVMLLGFVSPS